MVKFALRVLVSLDVIKRRIVVLEKSAKMEIVLVLLDLSTHLLDAGI
jgi:hypothetical protein